MSLSDIIQKGKRLHENTIGPDSKLLSEAIQKLENKPTYEDKIIYASVIENLEEGEFPQEIQYYLSTAGIIHDWLDEWDGNFIEKEMIKCAAQGLQRTYKYLPKQQRIYQNIISQFTNKYLPALKQQPL